MGVDQRSGEFRCRFTHYPNDIGTGWRQPRGLFTVRPLEDGGRMSDERSPFHVLMTTVEAADYIRMSPRTLEGMRLNGTGPKYIKLGTGGRTKVVYRMSDIEEWLTRNTINPKF